MRFLLEDYVFHQEVPLQPKTPVDEIDMEMILSASGPIRAFALARGLRWPIGPHTKAEKKLKAEYNQALKKYEQDKLDNP